MIIPAQQIFVAGTCKAVYSYRRAAIGSTRASLNAFSKIGQLFDQIPGYNRTAGPFPKMVK